MSVPTLSIDIQPPFIGELVEAIVMPVHVSGGDADEILKVTENVVLGVLLAVDLLGGADWAADRLHCGIKQRLAAARKFHPSGGEA
jgi:hypothetical protein